MLPDIQWWFMAIADTARVCGKWCDQAIIMRQGVTAELDHFTVITHQC